MKKYVCIVLMICLLLPAWAFAKTNTEAQSISGTRPPIRLGDNLTETTYWRDSGIRTQECRFAVHGDWRDKLTQLQGDSAPDLFGLYTCNENFEIYKSSGVLADLSGSRVIRNAVTRMRPETQRLLTTKDGKIIGFPNIHMLRPLYWDQEAWDAVGLTAADVPQSFTELLDFLENWVDRVAMSPEKAVCISDLRYYDTGKEEDYSAWLVNLLLITWETQQRYAGEDVAFHIPEFITLAERVRVVGQKLYQTEPSPKKRQKMLQLFYNETLESRSPAFGGRNYGLSHAIPLRITVDQPALLRANANIQCVRAGSEWLDEAIGYIEDDMNRMNQAFCYSLYMDFTPGKYGAWSVSEGWMKDFSSYDGMIVYLVDGYDPQKEKLVRPFAKGEITAQQLAEGLDKPLVQ
ncbi:MAG: extracellular solute-binding protein [Clostridia bacterium]